MSNPCIIDLSLLADNRSVLIGSEMGRKMFAAIREVIDSRPECRLFEISLRGVTAVDVCFARESVIALAKLLRGERGIYLSNLASQDVRDNWDSAAQAKDWAIVARNGARCQVLGPRHRALSAELFEFAMRREAFTAADVAKHFDISIQNASARLKKLHLLGLLLATKEPQTSGGLEYIFEAVC